MAEEAPGPVQQPTAHGKRSGAARRKLRKERQAQLDAQFANLEINPEATSRLPPELQLRIIQVGAELSQPLGPPSAESRARRAFLRQASLVCSLWRSEAQRLLWMSPHLSTEDAMKSFLRSNKTEWPVLELNISSRMPFVSLAFEQIWPQSVTILDGSIARRVIEMCKGVRSLRLGEVAGLDPLVFQAPALSDLRKLHLLETVKFIPNSTSLPSTHPFSLSSLHIDLALLPQLTTLSGRLIVSLLGATQQSVAIELMDMSLLTSQPLRGRPPPLPRPRQPLPFSALSLLYGSDVSIITPLLPALQACSTLQILTTNNLHSPLFAALPQPIRELRLGHFEMRAHGVRDGNKVATLLRANHRSLSQLERLTIFDSSATQTGLEALKHECRARGIELHWERAKGEDA